MTIAHAGLLRGSGYDLFVNAAPPHHEKDGCSNDEAAEAPLPFGHAHVGPVHVPRLRSPLRNPHLPERKRKLVKAGSRIQGPGSPRLVLVA
jgi:hypothetical protein